MRKKIDFAQMTFMGFHRYLLCKRRTRAQIIHRLRYYKKCRQRSCEEYAED